MFGGKELLILTTNFDGFSLVNHRRFDKFAKLSPHKTFLLYSTYVTGLWETLGPFHFIAPGTGNTYVATLRHYPRTVPLPSLVN